jgi:hypothetical protein
LERSHKYLNIATVALLAVIAAGFIFMPRYNHGVIVSRVANLSQKLAAVENTVEKLNILDGNGKEEKRSAVIGKIDYIVENLKKANEDQVSFMENISSTASSLEGVIVRLGRLEKVVHAEGHPSHGSLSEEKVLQRVEPVSYSSNQAIGQRLSPNQIAEKDFEGFLDEVLEKGWLPSPNGSRAARDQIAEHKIERLKSLFTSFRSAVQAINQCEHLFIEELVEKATKEGGLLRGRGGRACTGAGRRAARTRLDIRQELGWADEAGVLFPGQG